ncbi:MAG: hypothetical protein SOX97_05025 [Sutterella sp.]|nr:hypothetical protein [Sutterella sp.]
MGSNPAYRTTNSETVDAYSVGGFAFRDESGIFAKSFCFFPQIMLFFVSLMFGGPQQKLIRC